MFKLIKILHTYKKLGTLQLLEGNIMGHMTEVFYRGQLVGVRGDNAEEFVNILLMQ